MNVAVENADRSKPFQMPQRLGGILGPPAPLFIDRPKRHVREDNDRRAVLQSGDIFFQPVKLLVTKHAERGLSVGDVGDIDQPDEVDALKVKALPAESFGAFAESFEITVAVV